MPADTWTAYMDHAYPPTTKGRQRLRQDALHLAEAGARTAATAEEREAWAAVAAFCREEVS